MTQPSSQSPLPKKNGAKHPQWWAFAQDCIARLRATETDIVDLERRAMAGDTAAGDTLMAYDGGDSPKPHSLRGTKPAPSAAELMGRATRAPHLPTEEWDAIAADGGDPFATATDGSTRPASPLPLRNRPEPSLTHQRHIPGTLQVTGVRLPTHAADTGGLG
ncbi:hypothetical protein [Salipiger marinus]|uniref:hypothetical protein n=1 Tax=Salipiger marinus TaxID=555512 RepID=UPI004057DD5D